MPRLNPEVLRWARETAGLTLEEAASRLSIGPARGVEPAERLRDLEEGKTAPSRPLVARMAKRYRRPLVVFYLPAPPPSADRGTDFRTLPEVVSDSDEAVLDALMRSVVARQALVRAVLEAEDEADVLPLVGSATLDNGIDGLVRSLRDVLDVDLAAFRARRTTGQAFRVLREATEAQGVFVVLQGDLGSYHTALDLTTFRGFALADPIAPFVVVNTNDWPAAWSFTLLHELAHIWLGQTGVSGARAEVELERFCNDVASEYLLPEEELRSEAVSLAKTTTDQLERISDYAAARNVSSLLVAYRLRRRGSITTSRWQDLRRALKTHWREARERRRARNKAKDGGPDYYVVRRHRVGPGLLSTIDRMLLSGAITTTKAGIVLGVKPKNVGALLAPHRPGA